MTTATGIAALSVSASARSHAVKHITITVGYAAGAGDSYYANEFKLAERAFPGLTIKPVVYPTYDEQLNEMPQQAAAGTLPDVIVWDNSAPVGQYAKEGAIQPLSKFVAADKMNLKVYPSALVNAWTINNKLYGMPLYLQNSAEVYNLTMFRQAGITKLPRSMAQIAADAERVHAKTGQAGLTILDNLFHLTQYVLAFGGGWNYGNTIDSPQNVAGLQFLVNLFKSHAAVLPDQVGAAWDGQAVAENKAAISDGGPWYIGFMRATAPKVDYVLRPIPTSDNKQFVVTYGGSYSITRSEKDPAFAVKVLQHLTNATAEHAMVTSALGFVPAMTRYVDQYRKLYPKYDGITDAVLATGRTLDYPPKTIQFGNALVTGFQDIVEGNSGNVKSLLKTLQGQYGAK